MKSPTFIGTFLRCTFPCGAIFQRSSRQGRRTRKLPCRGEGKNHAGEKGAEFAVVALGRTSAARRSYPGLSNRKECFAGRQGVFDLAGERRGVVEAATS